MSNFNNFDDKENNSTFSLDNIVLEQYEKNEFMQAVINDLKQFFFLLTVLAVIKEKNVLKKLGLNRTFGSVVWPRPTGQNGRRPTPGKPSAKRPKNFF